MVKNIAPRVVSKQDNEKPIQASFSLDDLKSSYVNDYSYSEIKKDDIVKENENRYEYNNESVINCRLTPIGQYIAKYIIASDGDSLYIVDQHAAAERINYEKFSKKYNDQSKWSYTDLLVPMVINLTKKESSILLEKLELFSNVGITIEVFGEDSFRVVSIPTWMKEVDSIDYLNELIEQVVNNSKINLEDLRLKVISTLACKASLKANKYLSLMEMQILLNDLLRCNNPYTCPHGRPTMIIYSTGELDKLFRRT